MDFVTVEMGISYVSSSYARKYNRLCGIVGLGARANQIETFRKGLVSSQEDPFYIPVGDKV